MPFAFQKYNIRHFNIKMLLCILTLAITGILVIKSATLSTGETSTFTKQIMGVGLGFAAMGVVSFIDYHWILRMVVPIYAIMTIILFLTIVGPFGTDAGTGASRWIDIGPLRIQPSEFAKVGMIILLAAFFSAFKDRISSLSTIALSLVVAGIPLLLVLKEPDLSTSLVIMFIYVVMIFTAGVSYKWVCGVLAVAIPSFFGIIFAAEHGLLTFLEDYQVNRILSFVHPQDYPDLARQQTVSVMAIGSGGLYGKGLFNESLDSVKNGNFLMEEDTDFIFAVAGEELGFVRCCVLIALLLIVVIECLLTAARAQDMEGRLIAAGIAAQLTFQSFANIGVATFLLPNTGLPLPFISAGLSSLLSVFMGTGMVFNVGMQRRRSSS